MRRFVDRLERADALLRAQERRHFWASLDWGGRATHAELAAAGLLEPLPPEFGVNPAEIRADLGVDPEDAQVQWVRSLTEVELQALLLPCEWEYLRHVAPEFGRPNWEPRFLARARQIIGQEALTDQETRRLLELDGDDWLAVVRLHPPPAASTGP